METKTIGTVIDIRNIKNIEIPPADIVFRGLEAKTIGVLVAPGGTGKTFLILDIMLAVSTGIDMTRDALNVEYTGKVKYFNSEDTPATLQRRIQSLAGYLDDEQVGAFADNCEVISLKGSKVKLLDSRGNVVQEGVDWLTKEAEGQRLIIIDTLKRIHSADENSASHMGDLLEVLESICEKTECSILLVHHTNKAATLNGRGEEQGSSRGSSVITDNCRYQLNLSGMTKEQAQRLCIPEDQRRRHVIMNDSKLNGVAATEQVVLFRDKNGILTRPKKMEEHINSVIAQEQANYVTKSIKKKNNKQVEV